MSLNFDKTDFINGALVIYDDNGFPTFLPEQDATPEDMALIMEFKEKYPDGKPKPEIPVSDPIPTTEEKLEATQKELEETQNKLTETRASLENTCADFQQFMEYALSKLTN